MGKLNLLGLSRCSRQIVSDEWINWVFRMVSINEEVIYGFPVLKLARTTREQRTSLLISCQKVKLYFHFPGLNHFGNFWPLDVDADEPAPSDELAVDDPPPLPLSSSSATPLLLLPGLLSTSFVLAMDYVKV